MTAILRCDHCGDVIGVYEPTVLVIADRPWLASQAARPELALDAHERYHRDCYESARGPGAVERLL